MSRFLLVLAVAALAAGCQSFTGARTADDQSNVMPPATARVAPDGSPVDTRSMGSYGGTSGSAADGE